MKLSNISQAKELVQSMSSVVMLVIAQQKYERAPRVLVTFKGVAPENMKVHQSSLLAMKGMNSEEVHTTNGDIDMVSLVSSVQKVEASIPSAIRNVPPLERYIKEYEEKLANVKSQSYEFDMYKRFLSDVQSTRNVLIELKEYMAR